MPIEGPSGWVRGIGSSAQSPRLVCFPHAGGSLAKFRIFASHAKRYNIAGVELPGRGMRYGEAPFRTVDQGVAVMGPALLSELQPDDVLLGHSMGSLFAFAMARWLVDRGHPGPAALVVAAHRAPHIEEALPRLAHLSDDELVKFALRTGGMPAEVANDRELLEIMLPVLRVDCGVAEEYICNADVKTTVPLIALGGDDDTSVTSTSIAAWGVHAAGPFVARSLPGGHFFPFADPATFLEEVERLLASLVGGRRAEPA